MYSGEDNPRLAHRAIDRYFLLGQIFGSRSTGSTRDANLYENATSCPAGQSVVSRGSKQISPAYIGAPTSEPFVYCRPIPAPAPAPAPAPVAGPVYTTTISPVLQTEVSPMISPVFAQMQASPGAVQAGTPTMIAPGGMEATGGGPVTAAPAPDTAMMDFLRAQAERDEARRTEEAAQRERERVAQLDQQQSQQAYQREMDERAEKMRQQQLEMQRLDMERREAEQAGRDEQAAALQLQYEQQRAEWEQTQATPPQMITTAVMPGREMIPAAEAAPLTLSPSRQGVPTPLLIALGAAILLGGAAYYAKRGRKR